MKPALHASGQAASVALHTLLLLTTDARVGTSFPNTYLGYVISVIASTLLNTPLTHTTSCRTTSEVPF